MKYFINETERKASNSTCYYEFHRGEWDKKLRAFWKEDSLCIHDNSMSSLNIDSLIISVVPNYDPFGETEINEKQWNEIKLRAKRIGGDLFEAINEVSAWAEDNFKQYKVFTILGL